MDNMRIVRVTGKGKIKVKPDVTRITMTLEGTYPEYRETLRHSAQDTDGLKDALSEFGFERSDLKTLSFDVTIEYESRKENEIYKQEFAGYKFRHILKIEFDSDNERLGRILYALANCPLKPELTISYTVKDREAAKNELLGKAVADAKKKAVLLAAAADVSLRDIQSIDYSWGEIDLEVQPMNRVMFTANCATDLLDNRYDLNIEPDDIEASDTVTVVWEIV